MKNQREIDYVNFSLLDGARCSQHSVSGSLLLSGVKTILNTFSEKSDLSAALLHNIVLIGNKCNQEMFILNSILNKKSNISTTVLLLSSVQLQNATEVIRLVPPDMLSSEAFTALIKSMKWNRIGIVYDNTVNNLDVNKHFHAMMKSKKSGYTPFKISKSSYGKAASHISNLLQQVQESGAKVLVVLTEEAPHILCAAYARGMVWPYYGWIIYGYTSPDLTNFPACTGSFSYLEGTVFPTYYTYPTTKASLEDTAIGLLYKTSAQATLLNTDLKTALLRLLVPGIQPNLTFHDIQNNTPAVYFLQVRNGTATRVATVLNGTVAENQWLQEEQLPRGRLPIRVNTVYPIWLAAIEVIVSGSLITLTLILFVYYRNEPEIKATSWSLSLLMLLGCYLITAYLLFFILRGHSPTVLFDLCPLLVWVSALGLSYPLILSVLLVKLARVYRIFHHYTHIGKLCSDFALVVYVLLLLCPSIITLATMTSLHSYKHTNKTTLYTDHFEILHICVGDLGPYYLTQSAIIVLLVVCVTVAAITTRKLRHRNFRDAKKVNMFTALVVFTGISGLFLFKIFHDVSHYLLAYITSHLVHCSVVVLCLSFLFFPKLLPICYRKYTEKRQKQRYNGFSKELYSPFLLLRDRKSRE